MNSIVIAGYPKSGNTLLGQVLNIAGNVDTKGEDINFGIYSIRRKGIRPPVNHLFGGSVCTLKSHEMFCGSADWEDFYLGKFLKVITLVRNPFEVLLSSLNYFRVNAADNGGCLKTQQIRNLTRILPGYEIPVKFVDDFNLENLREKGLLEIALEYFRENEAILPQFANTSGSWATFVSSYDSCPVPVMNLTYEDLVLASSDSVAGSLNCPVIQRISRFLDVDCSAISEAFAIQRREAEKSKGSKKLFFNKLRSGYWRDYFEYENCRSFASTFQEAFKKNGYQDILEELKV